MQDIADAAGVSKMTVSRALKDHPKQSAETNRRIQRIARSMGYHIHPYLSVLMGQRARAGSTSDAIKLAVFYFDTEERARRHQYFRGVEERAFQLGYQVELFPYEPVKISEERLRKILQTRGIRGIILMPSKKGFAKLDFNFEGFAAAALGHTIIQPALPRVGSNPQASIFESLNDLVGLGYSRIGLVNTRHVNQLSRYLYSGAFHAYRQHLGRQLHLSELSLATGHESKESPRIERWIRKEKLDAIISSSFDIDIPAILTRELQIQIPESLGYIHLLEYPDPNIRQNGFHQSRMGIKAADLVVSAINHNDFSPTTFPYVVATDPEWVGDGSVRKQAT
ncbi:MAG: LacI family DNA-binding transcriptional regulator, partial [Puniceicoccales bacterium]